MNTLIKNKGTIYKMVDGGLLKGFVKEQSQDPPEGDPFIEWGGNPMPHSLWQSILAFFRWTFTETKPSSDEALIRIYYNEQLRQWLAWAPPQRGFGMTVKTVDDHPNWSQEQEFIGYQLVGTGHHHCSAAAFQSGTDSSDEKLCNGLHFTVGNLDKAFVSLHARAVFNGNMQEVSLEDWIELGDKFKAVLVEDNFKGLPKGFINELLKRASDYSLMEVPPIETQFPQNWKDNYLKWNWNGSQAGFAQGTGHPGHTSHNHHHNSRNGYWKSVGGGPSVWVDTAGDVKKNDPGNGAGTVTVIGGMTPAEKGEAELEQLMATGISLLEITIIAEHLSETHKSAWDTGTRECREVVDILNKHGLNPRWLVKWCEVECEMRHNGLGATGYGRDWV